MNPEPLVIGIGEFLWDMLPTGRKAGGAPVNFAYHASQNGVEGWAVSAVGDDAAGRDLLAVTDSYGIRTLVATVDRPTGTVDVALCGGQPSYTIHENVAWDYIPLTDQDAAALPCVDDAFRDKLFNLIEAQYNDSDFKIEPMSDMLGMSRVLLYRKITSIFGMSPSDLLRHYRLQKAVALLCAGRGNVSEIAYSVGFSSPAYFAKCFKSVHGVTPSEYMAQHQKE